MFANFCWRPDRPTCTVQGVTYQLTQGVVKNIIPAIASTNAIVAAACTLEVLKTVTMCSTGMDNYMMCAPQINTKSDKVLRIYKTVGNFIS